MVPTRESIKRYKNYGQERDWERNNGENKGIAMVKIREYQWWK